MWEMKESNSRSEFRTLTSYPLDESPVTDNGYAPLFFAWKASVLLLDESADVRNERIELQIFPCKGNVLPLALIAQMWTCGELHPSSQC